MAAPEMKRMNQDIHRPGRRVLNSGRRALQETAGQSSCGSLGRTHTRRGISLMEVLIATFVATVGLLSLASLIPVGKYQIIEGAKNDRGGTVGRAAIREVKVRDMLNPQMWLPVSDNANDLVKFTGSWFDWDAHKAPSLPDIPTDWGNSICIDPLFIARQYVDTDNNGDLELAIPRQFLSQFPYPLDGERSSLDEGKPKSMPNPPRMTRVSLRTQSIMQPLQAYNPTLRMGAPLAERIFTLQDDLMFEKVDDDTRTRQLFVRDTDPDLTDDIPGAVLLRQFAGDYNWLVTLTPVERGDVDPLLRNLYTVSVVVFYKRPMSPSQVELSDRNTGPPSERLVLADLLGGSLGYGGGDVRLWLPSDWSGSSEANPTDMPYTRAGQWLMLAHWVRDETLDDPLLDDGNAQRATRGLRAVFRWYRVVATEGEPVINAATGEPEQYVSLVGADLQPTPGLGATVHAALFDGVVAVYQKTMRLDR
jgi:hypothetical protein